VVAVLSAKTMLAGRQVGGGQPRHRPLGVGVGHGGRVQAVDPARGRHLAAEPGPELVVGCQVSPDHLDRDRPAAGRPAEEDLAHPAAAEAAGQAVRARPPRVVRTQLLCHA
jgi:hypothetical protein